MLQYTAQENKEYYQSILTEYLRYFLVIISVIGSVLSVTGCGGDGGENGAGNGGSSIIQGRVAQIMTALDMPQPPQSQLARLQNLLTLIGTAHAQATGSVAGITVRAQQNGSTVDTSITDNAGEFLLNVPAGNVTLAFFTSQFTVSLTVTAVDEMVLSLVLTLAPSRVVINEQEEAREPLRCTGGRSTITESTTSELVINGLGEACIRAEGNCDVQFNVGNLRLTNCEQCIRAEGNAEIEILANGAIRCDAVEDGVRAEGTALVVMEASGNILFDVDAVGVRAEGEATVDIEGANCSVIGAEERTRIAGNATISGCF